LALEYELILSPSADCCRILCRRMGLDEGCFQNENWAGALLVQGKVAQIIAAADVSTKSANVAAREVWGNCPQHITTIALVGDIAEVKQALKALQEKGMVG